MSEKERYRQDRYVQYIKHKKACSTNDKYHTYTGTCMVQKGYQDNVIHLFMYILKKTVNKHHQLLYEAVTVGLLTNHAAIFSDRQRMNVHVCLREGGVRLRRKFAQERAEHNDRVHAVSLHFRRHRRPALQWPLLLLQRRLEEHGGGMQVNYPADC